MSRKISEFLNLPVINLTSGSCETVIKNVLLDAEKDELKGFICENELFLPQDKIEVIGKDAVMIYKNDLKKIIEVIDKDIKPPLFLPEHLIGTLVISESGNNLGIIVDIIINDETKKIESLVISDGILKDLVSGRKTILTKQVITYGEDAVVIKEIEKGRDNDEQLSDM